VLHQHFYSFACRAFFLSNYTFRIAPNVITYTVGTGAAGTSTGKANTDTTTTAG